MLLCSRNVTDFGNDFVNRLLTSCTCSPSPSFLVIIAETVQSVLTNDHVH